MRKNKTNTTSIFFEQKLAYYRLPNDKMAEGESVANEFERRTSPEIPEVAYLNNPDVIITGVRDELMHPLGKGVLDKKVLNERMRARLGHLEMFSKTKNYLQLCEDLKKQIEQFEFIGQLTGKDIEPGKTPENIFGPGLVSVNWIKDDLITIRNKLLGVGLWDDFIVLEKAKEFLNLKYQHSIVEQAYNEEFAELSDDRFHPERLSTWLNVDTQMQALVYDEQYLKWVKGNLFDNTGKPKYADMEALKKGDLVLYNSLIKEQKTAVERQNKNSLRSKLIKILDEKTLENLSTSTDAQAMLAYLNHKLSDPEDADKTRKFIDKKAGVDYKKDIEGIDELNTAITNFVGNIRESFIERKKLIGFVLASKKAIEDPDIGIDAQLISTNDRKEELLEQLKSFSATTTDEKPGKQKENDAKIRNLNNQVENLRKEYLRLTEEKRKIEAVLQEKRAELIKLNEKILELINVFGSTLNRHVNNKNIWEGPFIYSNLFQIVERALKPNIYKNYEAENRDIEVFKVEFNNSIQEFKAVQDHLNSKKTQLEKKSSPAETGKIDARTLLYQLVERDLMDKGVTVETGLQEKALLTTNLLIARCNNQHIFNEVNRHHAEQLTKSGFRKAIDKMRAWRFFSPVLSGQDALEHTIDTDHRLRIFRDINLLSTKKDFDQILEREGSVSTEALGEFAAKLGELIKGFEVEKMPGKFAEYRLLSRDVPYIENIIHILTLISAELTTKNFLQELKEREEAEPSLDRNKAIYEMLRNQSENSRALEGKIAQSIRVHEAGFKRLYLKKELRDRNNKAVDELKGLPAEEYDREMIKRGLTSRVQMRGFVPVSFWSDMKGLKPVAKWTIGLPFLALGAIGLGIGKGAKAFGSYVKSIVWTEEAKKEAAEMRARFRGAIIEPVAMVASAPVSILSHLANLPRRLVRGVREFFKGSGGGHGGH